MAPIGLAHRPVDPIATHSGHGDPDRAAEPEARLHELVERRRDDAHGAAAAITDRLGDRVLDGPTPEGWLAGEPMF